MAKPYLANKKKNHSSSSANKRTLTLGGGVEEKKRACPTIEYLANPSRLSRSLEHDYHISHELGSTAPPSSYHRRRSINLTGHHDYIAIFLHTTGITGTFSDTQSLRTQQQYRQASKAVPSDLIAPDHLRKVDHRPISIANPLLDSLTDHPQHIQQRLRCSPATAGNG